MRVVRLIGTSVALVLALAGCGLVGGGRPAPVGPAAALPAASSAAPRCVAEGQSCADKSATCCAGLTCTGIGKSVCLLAY